MRGARLAVSVACRPVLDSVHSFVQPALRLRAKAGPFARSGARAAQDAHFVSAAGRGALGVSDGVSSWSEVGVDAAEYSRRVRRALPP